MTRTRIRILLAVLLTVALALALAACGGDDDSAAGSTAATTPAADCSLAALPLVSSGELTVGADKPAFPPYVIDNDPTNGKGFESAVAYAIADELGFAPDEVKWIVRAVQLHLRSRREEVRLRHQPGVDQPAARQKQVDFSTPYYTTPQGGAGRQGLHVRRRPRRFADLSDAQIGVQVGTTSLDAVNEVIEAQQAAARLQRLQRRGPGAQVAARWTRSWSTCRPPFYLRDTEVEGRTVVGQFAAPGGDDWGVVLKKGSGLTAVRGRGDRPPARLG